jgi:hypothetical protein
MVVPNMPPETQIADSYTMLPLPSIEAPFTVFTDSLKFSLSHPMKDVEMYYSLDGKNPQTEGIKYSGAVNITTTQDIKVVATNGKGKWSDVISTSLIKSSKRWKIRYDYPYSKQYSSEGDNTLIDEQFGGEQFRNNFWLGFKTNDLIATIDLNESKPIHKVGINCLQDQTSWIWFPTEVLVEYSNDQTTWMPLGKAYPEKGVKEEGSFIQMFEVEAYGNQARYIRITAKNLRTCPSWHLGAGGEAFIFADEIEIK